MNPGPLRMSSSDTSSDEKSDGIGARSLEEDPSKVDFHFLKTVTKIVFHASSKWFLLTGKSSKEGVLITYNVFKYSNNNCSCDLKNVVVYVQL